MYGQPFDKPGRFYKGNLHTHSTESDGHLSVAQVCQVYREAGYDFLAITDHFLEHYGYPMTDTRAHRTDDFTTLIGAELHSGETELGHLWHILAVGLPLDFAPPSDGESGPELAQRAVDAGAYVAAAHPAWYGLSENDILSLGPIHAIEIYNGTSEGHNDKALAWDIYDLLTMRGHRYTACATDDAHFNPNRADFALGWVQVKAEGNTPEALLEALKAGYYYSSTGPAIYDMEVYPGDKVVVRCSPAERVFVVGHGWNAASAFGNGLLEAEIDLNRFNSPFGRVIVRDTNGRCAWTNPFWFA